MRKWSLTILGIISVIVTVTLGLLSGAYAYSSEYYEYRAGLVYGPYHLTFYLWPIVVIGANSRWVQIRIAAKVLSLSYYGWMFLTHWDIWSEFFIDTDHITSKPDWMLTVGLVCYAILQVLIWVPSFFLVTKVEGWSRWSQLDFAKKHTVILIVLGIASATITRSALFLSGAMTGAGHGNYSLLEMVLGPFPYFVFSWPVLVVCANSRSRPVRLVAKLVTLAYYLWLVSFGRHALSDILFNFRYILARYGELDWVPILALIFLLSLHALIWLPSFFLVKKSPMSHPPKGLPEAPAAPLA
jgi:hypothetical protein